MELGEWRLIGPRLLSLIVFLKMRTHMTVAKTREFFATWLGLSLSDGCINTAFREAGRAAAYLEPEIIEAVKAAEEICIDETSWNEHKITRWLWAAVANDAVYYTVGSRSTETAQKILNGFNGTIMADGYGAYRHFEQRVRCWAHLERKAKALQESWDTSAAAFGAYAVETFKVLREQVYRMREKQKNERGKEESFCYAKKIEFLMQCVRYKDAVHDKTREFAREIYNDNPAIFRVLMNPELPLTNNKAERALRCWVILRNMCYGSKTEEGSKAIAILASVADTLRMRSQNVWEFLSLLIKQRRSGQPPPRLPSLAISITS